MLLGWCTGACVVPALQCPRYVVDFCVAHERKCVDLYSIQDDRVVHVLAQVYRLPLAPQQPTPPTAVTSIAYCPQHADLFAVGYAGAGAAVYTSGQQLPILVLLEQLSCTEVLAVAWGQTQGQQDSQELLVLDAQGCLTGLRVPCARRSSREGVEIVRSVADVRVVTGEGTTVMVDAQGRACAL